MRKLLFGMFVATIGLFSSCDKCKKADCQNNATCEKKVGDCECASFYEGDKCENEVRANYYGSYVGTAVVGANELPTTIKVSSGGSTASSLQMIAEITTTAGVTTYDLTASMTSNTEFTIDPKDVGFSLAPPATRATLSGSGTLGASAATGTINFKLLDGYAAGITIPAGYSGTK